MATKKQVLKNQITFSNGIYSIKFFVNEKEIKEVSFDAIEKVVCFRELLANLPSLQSKLELLLEGDPLQWFNEKLGEIDRRAKNEKRSSKVENKKEDFDLDEYLAKFNL